MKNEEPKLKKVVDANLEKIQVFAIRIVSRAYVAFVSLVIRNYPTHCIVSRFPKYEYCSALNK